MVDEDEGSESLGVCKVEDAARQADESVISILRGARRTIGMHTFPVFQLGAT